jgi:trk/ktr system potassium uptake protein
MSGNGDKHLYWLTVSRWVSVPAAVIAVGVLVAEFGFAEPPVSVGYLHFVQIIAAVLLWWNKIYFWAIVQRREFTWYKPVPDMILLFLLVLSLILLPDPAKGGIPAATLRWGAFQLYLLLLVLFCLGRLSIAAAASGRAPTRTLLISFAAIIFVGSILLMLPASHNGSQLCFTDAVFTATSATCVTGLIVRDTGGGFTKLGQTVILVMIQVGGLGIMIFGALFAMLLGSPLSLRESVAMRDIMNEQTPGRIGRVVVFICLITLALEALGAVGLYGTWGAAPDAEATAALRGGALYKSVFHSISAFCNAGFSLQADSLTGYRGCWQIYLILCPLIILGGLGFPVLHNLWVIIRCRLGRQHNGGTEKGSAFASARLTLHSKIVLTTTAALLLFGFVLFLVLEGVRSEPNPHSVTGIALLDSLFNSITARTAGFNTVAIDKLGAGSKLVLIFLMYVGGSPSSTAGGIKTVSFAIMVLAIFATMRRRREVLVFHRTIPMMIVRRVATLIMLYGLLLWVLTLLMTITENSSDQDMLNLFFEVASALGTVGLSTGVTGQLTLAGKWVIIIAMLIGRLGPLSLLAALTFNIKPIRYEYPHEPLIVG